MENTIRDITYPALEREASKARHFLPVRVNGLSLLFVLVVAATLAGMVVFAVVATPELSVGKESFDDATGNKLAPFPSERQEGKDVTAPFFKETTHEKNTRN